MKRGGASGAGETRFHRMADQGAAVCADVADGGLDAPGGFGVGWRGDAQAL